MYAIRSYYAEWLSRCPKCGTWGSYVLEARQTMEKSKNLPQAVTARPIHHGERSSYNFV